VQTVHRETNPLFHALLEGIAERTGVPVLVNTSFNVRGEPIVCTPEQAYVCFMRTEMDVLAIGPFVLEKRQQPPWRESTDWRAEIAPD
jgi:carbamoyltransferase